jgi:hypothetical protein
MGQHGAPERVTPDGYPATHTAIAELEMCGALRRSEPEFCRSSWTDNRPLGHLG